MAGKNFLSNEYVSGLNRMGGAVRNLQNRVGRPGGQKYNYNRQKYAQIDAHIADNSYKATEVYYTEGDWTAVFDGNTWGYGGDNDLTALLSFDNTSGDASGVHPVYVFGDSTANWWGFEWFDGGGDFSDVQYDFQGTLDGTDLTINGGFVSIDGVTQVVSDFSTDGAGTGTYWVDITASMNEGSYTFSYDIGSTINSGDIAPIWDEDSVSGDITWHLKVGEVELEDGTGATIWNQEHIGAFVEDGLDPGTVIADQQVWSEDFFATYDDASENRVAINYATIDMTTQRGLVANLEYTDIDDGMVLTAGGDWAKIESGANWIHWVPTITDSSDDLKHAFKLTHDGTTYTAVRNDGEGGTEEISGTTCEWNYDIKNHMYRLAIDGTHVENPAQPDETTGELPPAYVNYRYRHCSDTNQPDIILQQKTVSDYWSNDEGECYYFIGETETAGVDDDPSLENFSSCEECDQSSQPVRQFADCATSVLKKVNFAPADAPDSDFLWLDHDSTGYETFLEVVPGGDLTPTDPVPCFVDPASTEVPAAQRVTPAACIDVKYDAFGDNFSGASINACKWQNIDGASENVQSGGTLTQTPTTGNVVIALGNTKIPIGSDDYQFIKAKFSTSGFNKGVANPDDPLTGLFMSTSGGSTNIWINWNWNNASKKITPRIDGTFGTQVDTTATAGYYRIRKISGTVYLDFSTNGTSWTNYQSAVSGSSINELRMTTKDDNPTPTLVTTWDWIEIEE